MKRSHLLGLVLLVLIGSCSSSDPLLQRTRDRSVDSGDLVVSRIFALPPFTQAPMAAYFRVWNRGTAADTLLSVTSDPPFPAPMIHGPGMQMVGSIALPPGDTLRLEPGGNHLMFDPPLPTLVRGDSVPMVLHFARAGEVRVWAPVIEYEEVDKIR